MKKDTYETVLDPNVDKYLSKLAKKNKKDFKILIKAIKTISNNPYNSIILKSSVKKERRFKKGNYRIIFTITNNQINIINIGKRSNIYK